MPKSKKVIKKKHNDRDISKVQRSQLKEFIIPKLEHFKQKKKR